MSYHVKYTVWSETGQPRPGLDSVYAIDKENGTRYQLLDLTNSGRYEGDLPENRAFDIEAEGIIIGDIFTGTAAVDTHINATGNPHGLSITDIGTGPGGLIGAGDIGSGQVDWYHIKNGAIRTQHLGFPFQILDGGFEKGIITEFTTSGGSLITDTDGTYLYKFNVVGTALPEGDLFIKSRQVPVLSSCISIKFWHKETAGSWDVIVKWLAGNDTIIAEETKTIAASTTGKTDIIVFEKPGDRYWFAEVTFKWNYPTDGSDAEAFIDNVVIRTAIEDIIYAQEGYPTKEVFSRASTSYAAVFSVTNYEYAYGIIKFRFMTERAGGVKVISGSNVTEYTVAAATAWTDLVFRMPLEDDIIFEIHGDGTGFKTYITDIFIKGIK